MLIKFLYHTAREDQTRTGGVEAQSALTPPTRDLIRALSKVDDIYKRRETSNSRKARLKTNSLT